MRYLLLAVMVMSTAVFAADDDDKWDAYTEIDYKLLQVSPEEYKNKKVSYTGKYLGFTNSFPRYIEESGFDANKYWGLGMNNLKVPAIAKKSRNKGMDEVLASLKFGQNLKFYGKIKKFRKDSPHAMQPTYYLELVHIEVLETAEPAKNAREERENLREEKAANMNWRKNRR